MEKKKIRAEITALRKMLSEYDTIYLSERIRKTFCDLEVYKASRILCTYIAYDKEVRTRPIIEQAWAEGKKVAVPKILGRAQMDFHFIRSFDDLEIGYGGIYEPKHPDPVPLSSALVLVPGLAFDYELNRIGDGGGWYDRFFADHKEMDASKVALAYDFQIYKKLQGIEEHDERLDLIVTPTMVIS